MNKKRLLQLLAALIVLAVLFCLTRRSDQVVTPRPALLLAGVDSNLLTGIKIEQGTQSVELAKKDGAWTIPVKGDFGADGAKIRGLLLKLFDLSGSQLVTSDEKNFEALGVGDKDTEKGFSKVTLFGADGKELVALLAGESRRSKAPSGEPGTTSGQYLRLLGTNQVYLVGDPLALNGKPEDWLNTLAVNVDASSVRSVEQRRGTEREYLVERKPGAVVLSAESAVIMPPLLPGENVEGVVINQLGAALENLRLKDVLTAKEADEKLKDAPFDQSTLFTLSNGLVYTVSSAVREGGGYLRFDVRFDTGLAKTIEDEVKAANEKAKAEFETKRAENAQPEKQSEKNGEGKEPDKPVEQKASLSNDAEAEKLKAKFAPWVFVVEQYQFERFRRGRAGLLKHEDGAKHPAGEDNAVGAEGGAEVSPLPPN